MSIFQDIRTAIELTGEVRRARKGGCTVQIITTKPIPTVARGCKGSRWWWTWESTIFQDHDLSRAVHSVYKEFDNSTQYALCFAPTPEQMFDRIRFWNSALYNKLPQEQRKEILRILIAKRKQMLGKIERENAV